MAVGDPTGADLCSVTVDASTLPNRFSFAWTTFTFDSTASILSGKQYAIVVGTATIAEEEKLEWAQDTSAGYAGGLKDISADLGSTWTQSPTRDCFFKTRSAGGGLREQFDSDTPALQAIYGNYYIAQTFTTTSSYTISAVDLVLRQGTASTSGNAIVSIRNVEGEDYSAPTKASTPSPADAATDEDFSGLQLSWADGGGADTFDVYIGETGSLTLVSSAQAGTTYTTTMDELETIFEVSPIDQVIYWRVDATNISGTTTGDEWSFDARPAAATDPSPTDTATGAAVSFAATWTGSDIAVTYDTLADVGAGLASQSTGLETATWTADPNIFDYITAYTWRVDSINAFGTTTGTEWTFTTLRFDPPGQTYFYATTGQYYQLLVQDDGSLGDVPGVGIENTDYVYLAAGYEANFISTNRKLVAAAENRIWYEAI